MAKTKARDRFEDYAFRCELMAHPGNVAAKLAYTDWLVEHGGLTVMGAKRVVTTLVREATEARLKGIVEAWLYGGSDNAKRVLRWIYNSTELGDVADVPIRVELTSYPPIAIYAVATESSVVTRPYVMRTELGQELPELSGMVEVQRVEVGFRWIMQQSERWKLGCPTKL